MILLTLISVHLIADTEETSEAEDETETPETTDDAYEEDDSEPSKTYGQHVEMHSNDHYHPQPMYHHPQPQ